VSPMLAFLTAYKAWEASVPGARFEMPTPQSVALWESYVVARDAWLMSQRGAKVLPQGTA
jgi:hypothetical protein